MRPRDYACDEMCAAEGLLMLADRPRLILHVCNVCGASFDSHQALGGHMTCHRPKSTSSSAVAVSHEGHNCSICNRRFPSGQALGGHKRKHYQGSAIGCGRPAGNDKFSSGDSGGGPHQDRIRLDIDLKSCRTPSNNGLSNH